MLELLVLYTLNNQEQTIYGIAQYIAKNFGELSIPSNGALMPCIKKLECKNLLSKRNKFSEGGKKYTYYSLTSSALKYFNNKFLEFNNAKSETFESFLFWFKVHINIIDIVSDENISEFKEKCILKFNKFEKAITDKQNNEYLELSKLQKELLKVQKQNIDDYKKILDLL